MNHPTTEPLASKPRWQLATAVRHEGSMRTVAKKLGLPFATVRRAHRGRRLHQGSAALICAALAREITSGAWADVQDFHTSTRSAS